MRRVTTSRLEAFSDGVMAIIITIMVLELPVPHGTTFSSMGESANGFLTYVLSFVYIGIYWNNHHHMFQIVDRVNGPMLWANLHLLFWLSLFPLTTRWMDESDFSRDPVVLYGVNLLLAALAYYLLQRIIFRTGTAGPLLRQAVGRDLKGKGSPVLYLLGIGLAYLSPWIGLALFAAVAVIWLVPDPRLERFIAQNRTGPA
jgi:uncharacterized membrane protein